MIRLCIVRMLVSLIVLFTSSSKRFAWWWSFDLLLVWFDLWKDLKTIFGWLLEMCLLYILTCNCAESLINKYKYFEKSYSVFHVLQIKGNKKYLMMIFRLKTSEHEYILAQINLRPLCHESKKYFKITILKVSIMVGEDDVDYWMFHQDLISKVIH